MDLVKPEDGARARSRAATFGVCTLLAVLVFAVFGQTLRHGFLNFDDDAYVVENALVRGGLSPAALARAFTAVHTFTWHPLTTLAHMLDWELYAANAGGHHASSLVLHAGAAIALFLALRRATGALWRSALVALLFAVHPLRVESVAWISERKDVLSGLFFFATLAAYARYARATSRAARVRGYLATLACFALALLSKPIVVTLPFVLLLLDYWPLARLGALRARLVEKLPFLALSAASCAITLATQQGAMSSAETLPFGARVANALVAYVVYVRQLVWPVDLAIVYPYARSFPAWEVGLCALFLAGVTAAVVTVRRRAPFLLVGWLWYLGMLVPVIGLVQVGVQAHADRYTYLSHVGLFVMLCWGVAALWPSVAPRWKLTAGAAAVAALALLAALQCSRWRTSESLWRHTLACTQQNSVAHAQLGVALESTGRVDEAVEHYRAALAIQPDYATPRYNLANVLAHRGDIDGAIREYELAIRARPGYAKGYNNLGAALAAKGRMPEALASFARAVEADPDYVEGRVSYGKALAAAGKLDEALAQLREALRLDADNAEAHEQLAIGLAERNEFDAAIPHFQRAVDIDPDSPTRHGNLAVALERTGNPRAVDEYGRALELAEARGDTTLVSTLRAKVEALRAAPASR